VLWWFRAKWDRWRGRSELHELSDPFRAEVLLDGVVVAVLSDRRITDMFWRSYRIEPVGSATAIYDDALWNTCRFTFRDPQTDRTCSSGFVGGRAPFVHDCAPGAPTGGRVWLRALYFG
jgi:hypothetical protein